MTSAKKTLTAAERIEKKKKIKRRALRIGVSLLILVVVFRISLIFLLPAVMNRVVHFYKLKYNYDRLELSLMGGNVGIWGLDVAPQEGGDSIARADYVRARISPIALLTGKLEIWRLEADGVELWVDRDAQGQFPKLERFMAASSASGGTSASSADARPIDFSSPLNVEALRVTHLRAHYHDQSVTPEIKTEVGLDVRVSNLGSELRPTRFEVDVAADPVLTVFRIEGEARTKGRDIDAQARVLMRGLNLAPVRGYLSPLGIEPKAREFSANMWAELKTTAAPSPSYGVKGELRLHTINLMADERETFGIDNINIGIDTLDGAQARISKVDVVGVRASAARTATGKIAIGGVEIDPNAPSSSDVAAPVAATSPAAVVPAVSGSLAGHFAWSVKELSVHSASASFRDDFVKPTGNFALILDDFSLTGLANPPASQDAAAKLNVVLHSPGISKRIEVAGDLKLFTPTKLAALQLKVDGIRLDALKPYEPDLGIESLIQDGQFRCGIQAAIAAGNDGMIQADAQLKDVRLTDGDKTLLAWDHVALNGFAGNPQTMTFKIGTVDIAGPELSVERTAAGQLAALGMRTLPPEAIRHVARSSPMAATAPASRPAPQAIAGTLPRLELGQLTWHDLKLTLKDNAVTPVTQIVINDAGLEVKNFHVDFQSLDGGGQTGTIKAWLKAPGLADALTFDGQVTPGKQSVEAAMRAQGLGIKGGFIAPYLRSFGIEPALENGSFSGTAKIGLAKNGERIAASLAVENVTYADSGRELAAVDALRVKDFAWQNGELVIGAVELDHPRGRALREKNGAILAGGIRILPAVPHIPEQVKSAATQAAAHAAAEVNAGPGMVTVLRQLSIRQAAFDWEDQAARLPVTAKGLLDLQVDSLTLGRESAPATLLLKTTIPGSLEELTVSGDFLVNPTHQAAHLKVMAKGLKAGPFLGYLPDNIEPRIQNGTIHLLVDGDLAANPAGGQKASFGLRQIEIADDQSRLIAIDEASVSANRIDIPNRIVAVDSIRLTGIDSQFVRGADGRMNFGHILVGPHPQPAVAATEPVVVTSSQSARASLPDPRKLPLVTINELSFGIKKLAYTDEKRSNSSVIELRDFTVRNSSPIECLGPSAGGRPPIKLNINGQLWPAIDQLHAETSLRPFISFPEAEVDVVFSGIRGEGLLAILPELAEKIDGSQLTEGSFSAHAETRLRLDRRNPLDFDVSRGFDLDALLSNIAYKSSPGAPTSLGIEEIRVEKARIEPADGTVIAGLVELRKPIALVSKEKNGMTIGGFVLKGTPAATQPATAPLNTEPAKKVDAVTATPQADQQNDARQPTAPGEIRVRKLMASGLDVKFIDNTVDPPFVAPLTGMEVEARNLSSMATQINRPIRFNFLVYSGQVQVQESRKDADSLNVSATSPAATQSDSNAQFTQKDLFAQLAGNGVVSLYPAPSGWARASVNGLDLAAFRSLASASGVQLYRGTFDGSVDLRLKGDGSGTVQSRLVLTDLVMSEPPSGFFESFFRLPINTDTALEVLRDGDGSITLPVGFGIHANQIKMGELYLSAVGAVSQALAVGIASVPEKLLNIAAEAAGGKKDHRSTRARAAYMTFAPGSVVLSADDIRQIDGLIQRMRFDDNMTLSVTHEFSKADLELAELRANPDRQTTLALVAQLRAKRSDLERTRSEAAGQARAKMASGFDADAMSAALLRVQAVDREINQTDRALDSLADMLRPGADRQKDRRTRAAALEIGNERLKTVQQILMQSGVYNIDKRINMVGAQMTTNDAGQGRVVISIVGKENKGLFSRMFQAVNPF